MKEVEPPLTTELLILPDGQILVHNLTRPFAELLAELNPDCEPIKSRTSNPPRLPDAEASETLKTGAARSCISNEIPD